MQALTFRLRLNRAGRRDSVAHFAEALNMVSDHLDCLYHLVRHHPIYFDRNSSKLLRGGLLGGASAPV
jgi:hypothetical protein